MIEELRKFVAPEFIVGSGARFRAGHYSRNLGLSRVLVVSDPGVRATGWVEDVRHDLESAGVESVSFDQVSPNPKSAEVMAGVGAYRETDCQGIVVVGGGSPMDCAKGIAIIIGNGGHVLDYEGVDEVPEPGAPLICVPTTAGTAADVSQFAIITDEQRKVKVAIVSKAIVPDVALVDPDTTATMDPSLTACTGMDALTHAVEAYVSNANSPLTDLHALEAVRLVRAHLADATRQPEAAAARRGMMLASLYAGLAFSNASLGVVHAMAHSLGGYSDAPHGRCNALLLDRAIDFNFVAVPERYVVLGEALGLDLRGLGSSERRRHIVASVRQMREHLGIGHGLSPLGVSRSDVKSLSEKAANDPCLVTNPRVANRRDIEVMYEEAL